MIKRKSLAQNPIIVKIGGGKDINMRGVARDLAQLKQSMVVVLGGNAARDRLAEKLGMPTQTLKSVSGYESVWSDRDALEMIMMSYAGVVRNRFVETCQQFGVNAIGLSGVDGRLIEGRRNRGIRVREQGKTMLRRDYSGKPTHVETRLLSFLLDEGLTPVITIPIVDEKGVAVNADNDNIVTVLHQCLRARRIYQLIEAPGLLADHRDPNSLIKTLAAAELKSHEMQATGRMKRKLLALQQLFDQGPTEVIIADGRVESPIGMATAGTIIR